MDAVSAAAARALAVGDPLGALDRVALRDDADALALRGIALAQLGDFVRAKLLLRRAVRAFGSREPVARARCVLAEAEIALATRELGFSVNALDAAYETLTAHGDHINASHARNIALRRLLLLGRLDEAEHSSAEVDASLLPPALQATHELIVAAIAVRRLRIEAARAAFGRATQAAARAGVPALSAEVANAARELDVPAARLRERGEERLVWLDEVEALSTSSALVVDAIRFVVRAGRIEIAFGRRPVLFALVRALAEAWPEDVSREVLVARAFAGRRADRSHRARLRVELARLRHALDPLSRVTATARGFVLAPTPDRVVVLARPVDEPHARVLACIADGEAWSSSALALALGTSRRTMQRALDALAAAGRVQHLGNGPARRWTLPTSPIFTTPLFLPAPFLHPSGHEARAAPARHRRR